MVITKPARTIDNIHKRPAFSTLWHLQCQIVYGLGKVVNSKFSLDVCDSNRLLKEAFSFFLSKEWKDCEEVGKYCKIPVTAIIET